MAAKKRKATKKAAKKATKKTTAKSRGKATKKATKKAAKKTKGRATKKTTARKTTARATARTKTTTTTTARPAARELTVRTTGFEKVNKTRTKGQILRELAESTGFNRKEVTNFFDNLAALIGYDLTKGPGTFQIPGLMKITVVRKPAVPARKGINPFTGEEMMFKAKPARNVVRARPLKGLKDMVEKKG